MPLSPRGVLCSLVSQVLWGCYPVLGRYIQTHEPGQPSTAALLTCLTVLDAVILLPIWLFEWRLTHRTPAETRRRRRVAAGYGLLCVFRMWTNLQSTRLTSATNVQMTAMLLPFVTAGLAKVLLNEHLHRALPGTLIATVVGSVLALVGQGAFGHGSSAEAGGDESGLSWLDGAGIGIQLVSVILSACVKIALKSSEGVLSKVELMLSQFIATMIPMAVVASTFEDASDNVIAISGMDSAGWGCFFGLAFGIYLVANSLQIYATRSVGASNHSASNSLRLLSACVGSWALLGEPVESPLQWMGITMIIAALSVYWLVQRRDEGRKRQSALTQEMALAKPSGDDDCRERSVRTSDQGGDVAKLDGAPDEEVQRLPEQQQQQRSLRGVHWASESRGVDDVDDVFDGDGDVEPGSRRAQLRADRARRLASRSRKKGTRDALARLAAASMARPRLLYGQLEEGEVEALAEASMSPANPRSGGRR